MHHHAFTRFVGLAAVLAAVASAAFSLRAADAGHAKMRPLCKARSGAAATRLGSIPGRQQHSPQHRPARLPHHARR